MGSNLCKCCCKSNPDVNMEIKDNETECCENVTCCVSYTTNIDDKCKKECGDIDKKIEKLQKLKIQREEYYKEKKENITHNQAKKKSRKNKKTNRNPLEVNITSASGGLNVAKIKDGPETQKI